jgi:hypothetical protein
MPLPVVSAIRLLASSTQPDLGDGGRALALSSMCAAGPGSACAEVRESAICLLLSNIQVEADTWTLRSSHAPLAPGRAPVLPSWPGQRPEVVVLARLPAGHHAEGPVPGEPHPAAGESPAPVSLIRQVTRVPDTVLSRVNAGQPATPLQPVPAADPPLTIDGKSAIVFVSEESCPFCRALAADRRAVPLRHLEPPRLHPVLGHRRLPEHRHALVPRGALRQPGPIPAHHRADRQPRPPAAGPDLAGRQADRHPAPCSPSAITSSPRSSPGSAAPAWAADPKSGPPPTHDYEALRIGMQTLFQHVGIETIPVAT